MKKFLQYLREQSDWTDYPKGAKKARELSPEQEEDYRKTAIVPGGPVNVKNTDPITLGDIRDLAKSLPGNHPIHHDVRRYSQLGDKVTGHEKHPDLKRKLESLYDRLVFAIEDHESAIRDRGYRYTNPDTSQMSN